MVEMVAGLAARDAIELGRSTQRGLVVLASELKPERRRVLQVDGGTEECRMSF
jgi:hypothetical protein